MNLSQLLTLVANRLDDTKEPYLWSDEEFTSYANQRINELCEQIPILIDRTTALVCSISITAGTNTYATDSRIIYIHYAKLAKESVALSRTTFSELEVMNPSWNSVHNTPRAMITGLGVDQLLLYPNPIVNDVLSLHVARYPLVPLVYTSADSVTPEIPGRFHELLVPGMTSLAYLKSDAETENLIRAKNDLLEWTKNVEKIKQFYIKQNYSPYVSVPHKAFM